jgi:hypothetical protein
MKSRAIFYQPSVACPAVHNKGGEPVSIDGKSGMRGDTNDFSALIQNPNRKLKTKRARLKPRLFYWRRSTFEFLPQKKPVSF